MKCENIRELMSAYIDDEINEVDKAKFEKHIAQCPQCKEEYELLKEIVLECSEIDEVDLPEEFREELHSKLLEAKSAKPSKLVSFIRKNKWQTAGGAVAAVLILAISLNSLGSPKFAGQDGLAEAPSAGGPQYGISNNSAANENMKREGMGIASVQDALQDRAVAPTPTAAPDMAPMEAPKQKALTFDNSISLTSNMMPNEELNHTRKIIKNGNISLKVADVQSRIDEITAMVNQSGGYIENSNVYNVEQPVGIMPDGSTKAEATKVASITIKVPAERFEGSFQSIIAMGELVNQSTNSNDVTTQYRDIEARVENLKVQEKHLQEIMSKATTVEDTLKVEAELNRVRTEIDLMTGSLKNWDRLVEYSTIYINMTEVKPTELEKVDVPGAWQRAQKGFINTINNIQNGLEKLFVFLVSALPYIIILGAGSALAVFWIKKKQNKS